MRSDLAIGRELLNVLVVATGIAATAAQAARNARISLICILSIEFGIWRGRTGFGYLLSFVCLGCRNTERKAATLWTKAPTLYLSSHRTSNESLGNLVHISAHSASAIPDELMPRTVFLRSAAPAFCTCLGITPSAVMEPRKGSLTPAFHSIF